jgi:glycosyltransferase involved in cell wall biosynthesis
MRPLSATVVVPTTADRGPLLPFSVGSALRQTVADLEVFVIGDGVDDTTRAHVRELMAADPRIRFFDHPKGPRRGERRRHEALQEARGEIVCYLCDRDLMLPHHVAALRRLLAQADFATTLVYDVRLEGARIRAARDGGDAEDRRRLARSGGFPLSTIGHTLAAYRRLPHGWRETPPGIPTDHYMCQQFLAEDWVRAASGEDVTILYFNRGAYPGWPVERRRPELQEWSRMIEDRPAMERLVHTAWRQLLRDAHVGTLAVPPAVQVLVRGVGPRAYVSRKWRQLVARLRARLGVSASRVPATRPGDARPERPA